MADVFSEVDEQIRSARLQSLFRRNWPYAVGVLALALVAALCVWLWRLHETAAEGDASQAYADAMQSLSTGDTAAASIGFAKIADGGTPAYRALALMQQGAIRLKSDDTAAAAALFDRAADAVHNPVLHDAARLKAAFALMDTAPYADVRARLEPLTAKDRPLRMLAREGLAVAELASGRVVEARGDFQVLSLSSAVSDTTRARANAALAMISAGTWTNIAAIAKGAVGLKPAPPPPAQQGGLTPQQAAAVQAAQAQAQPQGQGQATPTDPAGAPQ